MQHITYIMAIWRISASIEMGRDVYLFRKAFYCQNIDHVLHRVR